MIARKITLLSFLLCCLVGLAVARPAYACTIGQQDACRVAQMECNNLCDGNTQCELGCVEGYVHCLELCE